MWGSRGEQPGKLRLASLCPARRSAVENDARKVQGPSGDQGGEMGTAKTGLRSGDALRRPRVAEGPRGATSSASHARLPPAGS